jgi:lipoprotein-anchoring transpeptidase ErfK/SrfK
MEWTLKNWGMAGLAGMLLLTGCAAEKKPIPWSSQRQQNLYQWNADGLSGRTRVVIDLQRQIADVTIGGEPAGWAYVATGKEGFSTPAGEFTVVEKVVDKRSTLYGWTVDAEGNVVDADADSRKDKAPPGGEFVHAPMPYWMRLTWNGVGMHAGRIPEPGEPASHGCIRLPEEFAPLLFDVVEIGTPVRVIR